MKKDRNIVYNLTKDRPKVLLLGNGLVYDTSISWEALIKRVSREGANISQYEETTVEGKHIRFLLPNSILTLVTSDMDDKTRRIKYREAFTNQNYTDNSWLKRLVKLPFDAILTTNYTYEIEASLNPGYPGFSNASKSKYAVTTKEKDPKYLLHTYNRVVSSGPDVWHIHGELRRPSSMVLSHDEYARYINRILSYNTSRGNEYEKNIKELEFLSWIDYFILGDLYILGFGMDFSEFDLWWLLGRRLRENVDTGSIFFYEPQKSDCVIKQLALADCGVTVNNCDVDLDHGGTFDIFYDSAIKEIESQIQIDN